MKTFTLLLCSAWTKIARQGARRAYPSARNPVNAHLSAEDDADGQTTHHSGSCKAGRCVGRHRIAGSERPGIGQRTDATGGGRSDTRDRISSQHYGAGLEDRTQRYPWRARAQPPEPHFCGCRSRYRARGGSRGIPYPADLLGLSAGEGGGRHRHASVQSRRGSRLDGGGRIGESGSRLPGSLTSPVRARVQPCPHCESFDCHHRQFCRGARHRQPPRTDGAPSDRHDRGRFPGIRSLESATCRVRAGPGGRRACVRAPSSRSVSTADISRSNVVTCGHATPRRQRCSAPRTCSPSPPFEDSPPWG